MSDYTHSSFDNPLSPTHYISSCLGVTFIEFAEFWSPPITIDLLHSLPESNENYLGYIFSHYPKKNTGNAIGIVIYYHLEI